MGFLDLLSSVVTPFLQHPVILFFLILLVVGADAYNATNTQAPVLDYGFHYCIITADIFINPHEICNQIPNLTASVPDQVCLAGSHYPDNAELQTLCLTAPDNLGVFGGIFTGIINTSGNLSNNQTLKDVKIYSWELFILMILTTFLVWAITASTRS